MNFTKIHITILTSILLIVSSCSRSQKALYTSNTENAKRFGLGTSPLQPIAPKPIAQVEEETNAVITPALAQEKSPITADNTTNSIITIPSAKKFSGISSLYSRKKQLPQGNCDDIIVLKNGEKVKCKLVEIGTKEIKYKRCGNLDGSTTAIAKSVVLTLEYANGTKEVINTATIIEKSEQKTHSLAIWALALSLISPPVSIVLGIIATQKINKDTKKYKGKWMAILGIVIGVVAIAVFLLWRLL